MMSGKVSRVQPASLASGPASASGEQAAPQPPAPPPADPPLPFTSTLPEQEPARSGTVNPTNTSASRSPWVIVLRRQQILQPPHVPRLLFPRSPLVVVQPLELLRHQLSIR